MGSYQAVNVEQLEYRYRGSKQRILNGLNMAVPCGSIYGLSGSSGCGKTTLISCILGIHKPDNGKIFMYGCDMASPNCVFLDIPGKDVGYMPQDISLYEKFTTREVLSYFGRLYGMKKEVIAEKADEFFNIMQLNAEIQSTSLEKLSGGQKRRVSLAVSLIHSPKLLVLDEPTVGMDPVLRVIIWDYLRGLVENYQTTIIITSHYLDEIRKSDKIGIMRNGRIIAEDSLDELLSMCNSANLEEAVLKLCKKSELIPFTQSTVINNNELVNLRPPNNINYRQKRSKKVSKIKNNFGLLGALVEKNVIAVFRNMFLFLFVMCVPAIQLLAVLIIGNEPTQLRLGIVNNELNGVSFAIPENENVSMSVQTCPENLPPSSATQCDLHLLSCRFIDLISKSNIFLTDYYSEEDAIFAVENGQSYGYIKFSRNFSSSLVDRVYITGDEANMTNSVDIFEQSSMITRFDQSNTIVYRLLLKELYKTQEIFLTSLLSSCEANPQFGEYPLQYGTPVFGGSYDFSFTNYVGTAGVIPFLFFYPIISSGLRFIESRHCGMLERTLFTGVKFSQILIAYLISEAVLVVVRALLIFSLLYWWVPLYTVEISALFFIFVLMMLAGYTGVSLGFLLGSMCTDPIHVPMIAISIILPNMFLSGVIWPLESMSSIVQTIVGFLPCTFPALAVRYMWICGLDITHSNVWPGFVVPLIYIVVLNFAILLYQQHAKR